MSVFNSSLFSSMEESFNSIDCISKTMPKCRTCLESKFSQSNWPCLTRMIPSQNCVLSHGKTEKHSSSITVCPSSEITHFMVNSTIRVTILYAIFAVNCATGSDGNLHFRPSGSREMADILCPIRCRSGLSRNCHCHLRREFPRAYTNCSFAITRNFCIRRQCQNRH